MDDVKKILMRHLEEESHKQERNELLQVAAGLAAGMNTLAEASYLPHHFEDFNTMALYQAKHLIELVDKEFEK